MILLFPCVFVYFLPQISNKHLLGKSSSSPLGMYQQAKLVKSCLYTEGWNGRWRVCVINSWTGVSLINLLPVGLRFKYGPTRKMSPSVDCFPFSSFFFNFLRHFLDLPSTHASVWACTHTHTHTHRTNIEYRLEYFRALNKWHHSAHVLILIFWQIVLANKNCFHSTWIYALLFHLFKGMWL